MQRKGPENKVRKRTHYRSRTAGQLCFSCLSPNWTVPKTKRSVSGVSEAGAERSGVRSGLESGSPLAAAVCGIYSEGPARSRA